MSKTLGEMTPEERWAACERALAQVHAELQANADAIGAVLDSVEEEDSE